jgi:hypothetical protein
VNKTQNARAVRAPARSVTYRTDLVAEPKVANDLPISAYVGLLEVLEKTAALANHLEESSSAVVVLGMGLEVVRQVIDAIRQDGNLHARGPCVRLVCPVPGNRACFFKCHDVLFSARPTRFLC